MKMAGSLHPPTRRASTAPSLYKFFSGKFSNLLLTFREKSFKIVVRVRPRPYHPTTYKRKGETTL